jgi:protease I
MKMLGRLHPRGWFGGPSGREDETGIDEEELMADALEGVRVAFVVANEGVEEVELTSPWDAVMSAGGIPVLIAPKAGSVQTMNHLDMSDSYSVDRSTGEAEVDDFHALVLPGGVANPDQLRVDEAAVTFVGRMFEAGKPAAAICHGPWTLVEADVVRDRSLTSWPSLQTDIENAGGNWVDTPVLVCSNGPNTLVTSRKPDDLDAFDATIVEVFTTARRGGGD